MSEFNPTPGPWHVSQPAMGFSRLTGLNGELIFGLAAGDPEEKQPDDVCEANARLLAASRSAYDLLKEISAAGVTDDDLPLASRVRSWLASVEYGNE